MGLMGTIACCWMMEHSWKDDNDDDDDDVRAFVRIKSVSERSLSWSFFFFYRRWYEYNVVCKYWH